MAPEPKAPRRAKAVMVLGTTSSAGKSWLTTALCRWYANRGLRVAPFKAQNMSNNARVVVGPNGGMAEIGCAQYFQALAARTQPTVDMNPVLLKPERDTASQVIVRGQVDPLIARTPWRERSAALWPVVQQSLHQLMATHDVVVIEGAGSPAEINLADCDIVNMRIAREANAACLLVTDIDRGGAFAHLYGTHQLLPAAERALIRGFVLNRFRGDASLLAPGPQQLEALTGVPTVAVLPMWREHGLPEEDGVFDEAPTGQPGVLDIAIVAYPWVSNLDEFQPLRALPNVRVRWVREAALLAGANWVILPGAKHTGASLQWMRERGLDAAICAHAASGRPLLGICGGLQMLGHALHDPHGVDTACEGLGLLPLATTFAAEKHLAHTRTCLGELHGAWAALSGVALDGYEIRHGQTSVRADAGSLTIALRDALGAPIGWQRDNILGLYAHGLFESPAVLSALFGGSVRTLDAVFEGLADFVDRHFETDCLATLIES
ncbi:cobyric acid synthase [Niveibacterium sp. 24ML]|uniref:cobyric acid synthase n=1 Tax=Niveibacterium sp. 24ML TaxID=2985512 RepID=UPI00226FFCBD|nr:cobyric acid synthase [Niveibacterium sp. 24ML]MCX9157532.1 cobyric acid synthase [Niveibacterium sp. 24ML]